MKLDILAFGAHPDDVELGCGGTIAMQIAKGSSVGIVDLTMGQLGTRGTTEVRMKEADASASVLGVAVRENLKMEDGFFVNDALHREKVIQMIRKYRPRIVLANAVSDRHPDHGKGADLLYEACFYSGLRKIETALDGEKQEAWRPELVMHYNQDYYHEPSVVIDISDYFETKLEAIMCFSSQFYDPNSDEPETPISGPEFMDLVHLKAIAAGRLIGKTYGEAFVTKRPVGVADVRDLL